MFDQITNKRLGSYVYALIDPRNEQPFYIGKGKNKAIPVVPEGKVIDETGWTNIISNNLNNPRNEEDLVNLLIGYGYISVSMCSDNPYETDKSKFKEKSILNGIESMWIAFEVFNLLDISNTTNYTWIRDVSGRQYSIPSFLTSRRLNLKLVARF